jgi:hypothetical protein
VNRSARAATVIPLVLLACAVVGLCLVLLTPAHTEFALLAVDVVATALLAALSAFVSRRTSGFSNQPVHPLQRTSTWQMMSRSQWLTLAVGLTAVAALTGVGTGVRLVAGFGTGAPLASPTTMAPASPARVPVAPAASAPEPAATTASPSESGSPSPSAADASADPTSASGSTTFLDTMDPVNSGAYHDAGPVTFAARRYPRSVTMSCYRASSNYVEWNVAGNSSFSATLGVSDDASNAFGAIAEFIFYDQDGHQLGKALDVSVGHAAPVALDLRGVVHLRVTCSGRDSKTNGEHGFYAALGNAVVVRG